MNQVSSVGFSDVYEAKHGENTIYVGHDQVCPVSWSVFVNGKWEEIDGARTLRNAKELGHSQFDKGDACPVELDWRLDWPLSEGTQSHIANACPECGNPITDDYEDEGALRCPDCGWEHQYTSQENDGIRHLAEGADPLM